MSTPAWRQIALGEEAAVYAYGVLAARLAEPERSEAKRDGLAHTRARDRARSQLAEDDADPGVPAAFEIPFAVEGASAARRLAALVENRLVDVYCTQAVELEGEDRKYATQMAQEAAGRAVTWGARPQAFPGRATERSMDDSAAG